MDQWEKLKISITTKANLFQDHCVDQVVELKDLVSKKEEHIERYHQQKLKRAIKEFDKQHNSILKVCKIAQDRKVRETVAATYHETKRRRLNDDATKMQTAKMNAI